MNFYKYYKEYDTYSGRIFETSGRIFETKVSLNIDCNFCNF